MAPVRSQTAQTEGSCLISAPFPIPRISVAKREIRLAVESRAGELDVSKFLERLTSVWEYGVPPTKEVNEVQVDLPTDSSILSRDGVEYLVLVVVEPWRRRQLCTYQ